MLEIKKGRSERKERKKCRKERREKKVGKNESEKEREIGKGLFAIRALLDKHETVNET